MSIEPDLMTGSDPNNPKSILLLTHSGSAKESEKKMWRNLGELVEAKTVLPAAPLVYCLTFGLIKDALERIQQNAFDCFVWVRPATHSWADALDTFIDSCVPAFPKGKDNQIQYIAAQVKSASPAVNKIFPSLTNLLQTIYGSSSSSLNKMWSHHRLRSIPASPAARVTMIRRGAAKLYLFPDIKEAYQCFKANAGFKLPVDHLEPLGLVIKRPGGWYPQKDGDVVSCVKVLSQNEVAALFLPTSITAGFQAQAEKVRYSALVATYANWCASNWSSITTPAGMRTTLLAMHSNPSAGLSIPSGNSPPSHVWIMDILGAYIRTHSKKSQGFGFSNFAKHPKAQSAKIGNMDVGSWTSCFMNQFFTRRPGFNPPPAAIDFTAQVLSEIAVQAQNSSVAPSSLLSQYIAKEYEAVYLTHRGFEPLWGLLEASIPSVKKLRLRTCFAEAAGISGISGNTSLAKAKNTLINWQSVSDAGRDHKKKELSGRAIGLRYHWNGKAFVPRPGVNKLLLLLDGTWRQEDLNALLRAGWDAIYYPDEVGLLAKAIV